MRSRRFVAVLLVPVLCAFAAPAAASFHVTRIVQIYGGAPEHPDAQYVVLQMCISGQNQLQTHSFGFFDAAGAALGTVTFPAPMANFASQAKVLVATSSAESLFGVTADLRMPASFLIGGGKVCFVPGVSPIDCVGWGNYTALPDATIGTPYGSPVGLPAGEAIQRDLTIAGGPTTLDCFAPNFDDTNDSAADFDPVAPTPVNNGNVAGVLNPNQVFLHGFENGTTVGWSSVAP